MKNRYVLPTLLVVAAWMAAGCLVGAPKEAEANTKPGKPMGANAPAFESDWSKFIVGRWSPFSGESIDPALAKQLGVESVNEGGEVDVDRWWNFTPDGKFTYRTRAFSWQVEGTWNAQADGVSLTYATLDGVPLAEAQMKVKERAESGRQGAILNDMAMEFVFDKLPSYNRIMLGDDKQHVYFSTGSGEADPAMGSLGGLGRLQLERVE